MFSGGAATPGLPDEEFGSCDRRCLKHPGAPLPLPLCDEFEAGRHGVFITKCDKSNCWPRQPGINSDVG